jgi:hypothetical protein
MRRKFVRMLLLASLLPATAQGQARGLAAACAAADQTLEATCRVAAQAVESAQPAIGILISGGNPTIGTASAGGLRLGVLPRVSATVRANLVFARVPDLREIRVGPTDGESYGDLSFVAPSLAATASVGLFSGLDIAPTVGGIGALDLLASASWLPLNVIDSGEFQPSTADFSYGGGLRVGLLRESFTMPGASISVMHHRLGTVAFGEVCSGPIASTTTGSGYTLEEGECVPANPFALGPGDMGEFRFDLSSWNGRAVVSKHLLGLGLSAGIGYDHFSSDLTTAIRTPHGAFGGPPRTFYARVSDVDLSQSRWSAFVDGSFSILVATFAAEAGWQQGGDAVAEYPESFSDFDPGDGTFFGSVGLRVAL